MKIFKLIMKPFKWIIRLLKKRLLLYAGLIIGFALIFIAAFSFQGVPLIVCLIIGSLLVLGSWIKAAFDAYRKGVIERHEAEKLTAENRELREREYILNHQLEEARKRKLKVLNVQPILELSVLEADCQITECFDLVFDKNGEIITWNDDPNPEVKYEECWGDIIFGSKKKRFIGTLTVKFTARYGIKMQNLRVRLSDANKTVLVEGAEPSYTGSKGFPETYWKGCVTLREQWDGIWISDEEAVPLESPCKDFCRGIMEESLKNGPEELEWLKRPLQNTIRHLLQMMITPQGYSVEFVEKIEGQSVPFFEYAADLGLDRPRLEGGVG